MMRSTDSSVPARVVQVLYSGLGGHASVAFSLISGDRGNAWQHELLFVGVEPLLPSYADVCKGRDLPFRMVRTASGRPWSSWHAVYKALRRSRPDIVLLHSVTMLLPAALYCFLKGAKLVSVLHTPLDLRSGPERQLASLAAFFGPIVVLTEAYRAGYESRLTVRGRARVIPNGVDVSEFSRDRVSRAREDDSSFLIGMAARFTSTKRQDVLIEALALLSKQVSDIPWRLSLAGDGEQRQLAAELAERLGIIDRVDFVGHLDEEELRSWFASLDLYAHASEGEALSTSMLQAMSMQCPMVASDVPGIANLLSKEPKFGTLVDQNTGASFAAEIKALQADPHRREVLGREARARVVGYYSNQTMFDAYNRIVQECLN